MIYNTESGFVNSPGLGSTTGFATQGTRFIASFENVPPGVHVWVTTGQMSTSSVGITAVAMAAGSSVPLAPTGSATCSLGGETKPIVEVPLTSGSGTAYWEITDASPIATSAWRQ